jgi:ribosomal protein S18 acetylase RimI-like enzyme
MTRYANENGFCELNPFPGCNQIVISNHAFVYPEKRGKGHGTQNHLLRVERATNLGYDLILCTVREDNRKEKHILNKEGWQFLTCFLNSETGHEIELWSKRLYRAGG